jgi:pyrimidine operon attenuation protein / uracil phosphoribosyltransferase
VVGQHLSLRPDQQVKLRGHDPLRLEIANLSAQP